MANPARRLPLALALAVVAAANAWSADEALLTRVAVAPLVNESDDASGSLVGRAVTETIDLNLRLFGKYRVERPEGIEAAKDAASAGTLAEREHLDSVVLGSVKKSSDGSYLLSARLFDRSKAAFTISREARADTALDIFDAADELARGFLEAISGQHIGFGRVVLANSGEKGAYSVTIDGAPAGENLEEIPKVLNGSHIIAVTQSRLFGVWEAARQECFVREDGEVEIRFAIPYTLAGEAAVIDPIVVRTMQGTVDPVGAADAINELARLLASTPYSPRLGELVRGMASLSLASDPPGIKVIVDGGEELETPVRLELDPGLHSFQVLETQKGDGYYEEQPRQPIALAAGSSLSIPIKAKLAMVDLSLRLVPPGYSVFVNGEKVGVTPLGKLRVKAGRNQYRFERAGEKSLEMFRFAAPGREASLAWGTNPLTAISLERRSIDLDKPDSWDGIEPMFDVSDLELGSILMRSFMGEKAYGITRAYLCRDDKYLYWRVDFAETNPLLKMPKGVKKAIQLEIEIDVGAKGILDIGMIGRPGAPRTNSWMSLGRGKKWETLEDGPLQFKNAQSMVVARIALSKIEKYFGDGIQRARITLRHLSESGTLSSLATPSLVVDIRK
jgi:TolB-like protein